MRDVVAEEGEAGEGADAILVAIGVEEYEAGLGAGEAQFDPTLLLAEGLVCENNESQLLGIEVEGGVLVADGNGCEFDGFDHGRSMLEKPRRRNVVFDTMLIKTTARLVAILLAINFYVCRELFHLEYSRHMGSIEGAYIGISRYALAHWRDLSWFPLWYGGIPYQNTYPPLLHWGVALVAWVRGISPALAYHWTTGLAYCLGPVTLFLLVRRLSGSRWAGFAAGLVYTAVSPSAWLIPAIAHDLGGPFRPRRLMDLVYYGEGPHVAAMTLLPLAILLVDLAFRKRKGYLLAAAAVAVAAVVLTNWLAAFALALGIGAYMLAIAAKWRDVLFFAAIGAAAYGLAMPWAPPSTIAVTQSNARTVGGDYTMVYQALPGWLVGIACGLAGLKFALRRFSTGLQFAVFFAFLTVLITLSEAWFHRPIVPQAVRYHLEMEMALAMLAGIAGHEALKGRSGTCPTVAMGLLVLLLALPLRNTRHYAHGSMLWSIDVTKTSEWKTADWLNRNWPGKRVMLPGSSAYWLTAFSDTPELGGGFEQGRIDDVLGPAGSWIRSGTGEGAVLWLKALGVQAVAVSGPGSTEAYRDFADPGKFEGVLEPLWRVGGDVLYRVGKRASLARVVPRTELVGRTPMAESDVEPLRRYVAAIEDTSMPEAVVSWSNAHTARIVTALREGWVVSWQVAWHPGWHARVGGVEVPIEKDALGLMTIYPRVGGACVIDLNYDGGVEMRIAQWISGITALALLGWAVYKN